MPGPGQLTPLEKSPLNCQRASSFLCQLLTRAVAVCAAPPGAGAGAGGAGRKEVTPGWALGWDADMWTLGGHY